MSQLVVALLLALPPLLKALYVDNFIHHYTGTRFLGFFQVLSNDAAVYAALLLALYLSCLPRAHRALAAALRLLALALYAVYLIDYIIIVNFNTHLALGDAIKYTGYAHKYIQQIYGLNDGVMLAMALTGLAAIAALAFKRHTFSPRRYRKLPAIIIAALPLAAGFTDNDSYAHAWIYKNVFDYNLTILSESSPYSPAFAESVHADEPAVCQAVPAEKKNIIILMVESLSSYQSRFFSGIHDWTPKLDAIAVQHLAFKNFYANGFITEDGEIALLTGLPPIYPPSSYNDDGGVSFASFYGIADSLPRLLKRQGYKTGFITTADLDFGNTGVWARGIGFDYVDGHDHPDYQNWERFHFQAAPDEALYRHALNRIREFKRKNFLLFIKTVSTHHPYVNPENKHESEAEAFQYADKQIGNFYQELAARKFFDNGLLIIVGDHHSMTPLKKAEADLFGHFKASAKIPLVVVTGNQQPAAEQRQYQQTDVFNTLQGMVSGRQCHSDWQGVLWGDQQSPPKFIPHRRGDNRDRISVFTENEDYLIKLDGDATHLIGQQPVDQNTRQLLVDKINALRIRRANWATRQSAETSN